MNSVTFILDFVLIVIAVDAGVPYLAPYYDPDSDLNATHTFRTFRPDFLFGVATSAYQVEGSWNVEGKGENIWDHFFHARNQNFGDVACDSYQLFKEDIELVKEIGFQVYRFSISWARILPDGDIARVNAQGVKHYMTFIDELLKNGIQPMVTMYHWDLPQRLQDVGGWMNPIIADYMEDYADLLFQLYGTKVKYWVTINEPSAICHGYAGKLAAPGTAFDALGYYKTAYNVLRAHARVYRLYDRRYRASQKGNISICIDSIFYQPKSSLVEDLQATHRAWAFYFELFANPIYSSEGDFPALVKAIVTENSEDEGRNRSRLPKFTAQEVEFIRGSSDFFSLNHYCTWLCTAGDMPIHSNLNMTLITTRHRVEAHSPFIGLLVKDRNYQIYADPKWPINHCNWSVVPWGMRESLRFIKTKYNDPYVFITENGYCGGYSELFNDVDRINYYREYLLEVINAKENFGVRVIGFTAWSLLDNVEWNSGYDLRFGLVYVNFSDPRRSRTLKASAKYFQKIMKTRIIPP